jgi:hypothetical protein
MAPDVEPVGFVVALVGLAVVALEALVGAMVGAAEDGATVGSATVPQSNGQSSPSSAYVHLKYNSMSSWQGWQSHVVVMASQMVLVYSSHDASRPGMDAPTHMSQS